MGRKELERRVVLGKSVRVLVLKWSPFGAVGAVSGRTQRGGCILAGGDCGLHTSTNLNLYSVCKLVLNGANWY